MKLKTLRLKNITPFKEASFDFEYEGITQIRGDNRDAAPGTTNAAGKSALFGAIPDLIEDESPTGKVDKVKGVKEPKSRIELVGVKGKHTYTMTKMGGKGKSYEILKDGKTLNVRTVAYSQERIKKLFGMSGEQFYTQFYLDGTIPHPLIVGKAAAKQEFIVDMFDLANIDNIRSLLNAELKMLSKKSVEFKTLMSTYNELKDDLEPKEKRIEDKSRLEKIRSQQEELSALVQESQSISELISFEISNAKLIEQLSSVCEPGEILDAYKETKKKVQKLEGQEEAASEWTQYRKSLSSYAEQTKPLRKALKEAGVSLEEVEAKVDRAKELQSELATFHRQLKGINTSKKPKKVDEPKYRRDLCVVKINEFQVELNHVHKMDGGKCPTCGSKVAARKEQEVKDDLSKWKSRRDDIGEYEDYQVEYEKWKRDEDTANKVEVSINEAEAKLKKLKKYLEIWNLRVTGLNEPHEPKSEDPGEFDANKLKKAERKLNILRQAKDLEPMLVRLVSLTDKQRSKAHMAREHMSKMGEINSEVTMLTANVMRQSDLMKRMRGIKDKTDMLEEVLQDEKILKGLVGAYSTSGLKRFMIERYSKMLEQQINKYRRIFFNENYEFEFRYDTKLSVIVHRTYSKKVKSSDVKKLSGAEKRMFTLLLFVATTTMMPVGKRMNALVLDEPESQMGETQIEQFIRALPVLQKLVPHIIIITPKIMDIPGSRVFTVIKKDGVARIVAGTPKKGKT